MKIKKANDAPVKPAKSSGKVHQHAYEVYRERLPDRPLSLADWVLMERDILKSLGFQWQ